VDAYDHLFILQREDVPDSHLNAGRLSPPLIEGDAASNLEQIPISSRRSRRQ
jgi:hypothetical protein